MPAPIAVVPAIETSQAMQQYGFAAAASIDAQAFVSDLLPGDGLAVASIGAQGQIAYPSTPVLVTVDNSLSQLAQANAVIAAFTYASASADLGGGLQGAYNVLEGAAVGVSKAVLLISSGQSTTGTDPLRLPSYAPTWACAPGPAANAALLNQIAAISGGAYYYMPGPGDMATVLNQIRGRRPGWTTVLNQAQTVQPLNFWLQPVTLASGLAQAQFSIVWEDATRGWTGSSNPAAGQVSVTLVQPPGIVLQLQPSSTGGGYCIFDIATPVPGQWYVQVMYPGAAMALPMTAGVFCLPSSNALPRLTLSAGAAGDPVGIEAELDGDGERIEILSATADLVAPGASLKTLLSRHAGELERADGPSDEAALSALRASLLPRLDIFEHRRRLVPLAGLGEGRISIPGMEAACPGSLNCKIHVQGRRGASGDRFELTELISVHIPETAG